MDLSKLPRLSESDRPVPPAETPPAAPQLLDYGRAAPGGSGQVFISAVLGIVFMMMGITFAKFLFAKLTGQTFHTGATWSMGPNAGQEVDYYELAGYTAWTETAIFLLGLAMVFEAIILGIATKNTPFNRKLVAAGIAVSVVMTVFNTIVVILLFKEGTMPIISFVATAFGGWMVMQEWQLYKLMKVTAGA